MRYADKTIERSMEVIKKRIAKLNDSIEKTYEKYPADMYGCRADNYIDKYKEEIRELEEYLKLAETADRKGQRIASLERLVMYKDEQMGKAVTVLRQCSERKAADDLNRARWMKCVD